MANRAYLYFSDNSDKLEKADFINNGFYIDSRNNVPLVWWFLFDSNSVRTDEVHEKSEHWNEVRLTTKWSAASNRFSKRVPSIVKATNGLVSSSRLNLFLSDLSKHAKEFLVLDPNEIFQGEGDQDEVQARKILALLESNAIDSLEFSISVNQYSRHMGTNHGGSVESHLLGSFYE